MSRVGSGKNATAQQSDAEAVLRNKNFKERFKNKISVLNKDGTRTDFSTGQVLEGSLKANDQQQHVPRRKANQQPSPTTIQQQQLQVSPPPQQQHLFQAPPAAPSLYIPSFFENKFSPENSPSKIQQLMSNRIFHVAESRKETIDTPKSDSYSIMHRRQALQVKNKAYLIPKQPFQQQHQYAANKQAPPTFVPYRRRSSLESNMQHNGKQDSYLDNHHANNNNNGMYHERPTRTRAYKPYSQKDYEERFKNKDFRRGGLGADLQNEQLMAKQKQMEQRKAYAHLVKQLNNNKNGSMSPDPIEPEIPTHRLHAEQARRKMMEFASKIPKPKLKRMEDCKSHNGDEDDDMPSLYNNLDEMNELDKLQQQHEQDQQWLKQVKLTV